MCQFQLDFEEDMKALLIEAYEAGGEHCAWGEGMRGATVKPTEVDEAFASDRKPAEVWAERKIRELLPHHLHTETQASLHPVERPSERWVDITPCIRMGAHVGKQKHPEDDCPLVIAFRSESRDPYDQS